MVHRLINRRPIKNTHPIQGGDNPRRYTVSKLARATAGYEIFRLTRSNIFKLTPMCEAGPMDQDLYFTYRLSKSKTDFCESLKVQGSPYRAALTLSPESYMKLKANRRTAKYRMPNVEVWNRFRLRFRLRPDRSLILY